MICMVQELIACFDKVQEMRGGVEGWWREFSLSVYKSPRDIQWYDAVRKLLKQQQQQPWTCELKSDVRQEKVLISCLFYIEHCQLLNTVFEFSGKSSKPKNITLTECETSNYYSQDWQFKKRKKHYGEDKSKQIKTEVILK